MRTPVLLLLVVALAVAPLLLHRSAGTSSASAPESDAVPVATASFEGADAEATALIETIRPGYRPWVSPLFEPPSGEIESLLFALQAALGSGALFYVLGYMKGRHAATVGAGGSRDPARSAGGETRVAR